jgi:hypothetical protein
MTDRIWIHKSTKLKARMIDLHGELTLMTSPGGQLRLAFRTADAAIRLAHELGFLAQEMAARRSEVQELMRHYER